MMATGTITSYRTVSSHLHVVGDGRLPELTARALTALITSNGETTQALVALCLNGYALEHDAQGNLKCAEIWLPCRENKIALVSAKADEPAWNVRQDAKGKRVEKKWYGKGNSYALTRFDRETGRFAVRVLERYEGTFDGRSKTYTDKLSANFLQAVFMSFLKFPFSGMPDIMVKPALKQTAEQIISNIQLLAGEEQEAGSPSMAERNPARRRVAWEMSREALTRRTEPMDFVRARDHDPRSYDADDPRGDRYINITPEWIAFTESPFPARLPLKIIPEFFGVFRRQTDGHSKIPERLYLCLRMFDGAGGETELGRLAERREFLWWHKHQEEFSFVAGSNIDLTEKRPLLMAQLEYDREGRFEQAIGSSRKIALVTLKEHRNNRGDRNTHTRKRRLPAGERLWRADFSTSAEVLAPEWNGRVLGLHFADDPVVVWTLVDQQGTILEEGNLLGNPILERGLAEKEKLEILQKKGKWVQRGFDTQLKTLTHELARAIVLLAVEKNSGLALEEIHWVDKQSGASTANRRFSMWNFSRLPTLIEWLGVDIATRERVSAVPVIAKVSDYLTRYTCPVCGWCRQAKQNKETAYTWREGNELHCRGCQFRGAIPIEAASRLVALKALEVALKRNQK